ncbi:MAG: hypothetical protein WC645_00420 [Candidatus Margulisiibacteriota bacterium]
MIDSPTAFFTVGRSLRMATFFWHGYNIRARSYRLQGNDLKKLGINPAILPKGVEICLASRSYFRNIHNILKTEPDALQGIYIPGGHRKVMVPDDIGKLELTHEILHAVFDAIPLANQEEFSRLVAAGREREPESRFYRGVAGRSNSSRLIATEAFAFGGSKVIFERMGSEAVESDLGEVPPELKGYFERLVVDPRLLQAAA